MNIDFFTEEDSARFKAVAKNAVVCMLYCPNAYVGGLRKISEEADLSPFAIGGVAYLPGKVFTELLGVSGDALNGTGISASCRCGAEYYPAVKTCEALCIPVKLFYDGRMIVMADSDAIDAMSRDARLVYAGSYELYEQFDAYRFTHQDYVKAKDSYRRRLVGDEALNDLSSPEFVAKLNELDRQCDSLRQSMNRGENIPKLWGDEPPAESCEVRFQYAKLYSLVRAFGTYGCKNYGNEEVKADILFGFQWLYENMYGEAEIEERSKWRSIKLFNWWDWYVGAPEHLTDALLVMENHLTKEQIKNYLKLFEYVLDNWQQGDGHAQGRSRVGAKAALLLESPERLMRAHRDYDLMLGVVDSGNGLHRDFVHYWHGFPYNLMYGLSALSRILTVSSAVKGTPLEFRSPREYNQFLSAKYMLEAAVHNGRGFSMFNGRGNSGSETGSGITVVLAVLPLIGLFGEDEDAHLKKFVKRSFPTEELRTRALMSCSVAEFAKLKEIFDDENIPTESDYELGYVWYTGDRAAQHRKKYSIALAVCSEREPSYESINSANKFGWYTGDGAIYLYTDHDRGAFDGENFYSNRNIGYRIPGTTVDSQERIAKSITIGNSWRTSRQFAGGLAVDGKYVVAGFDYESFHFEGPDTGLDDSAYGGGLNIHKNDLVAKKSWFMFDNECVCLGAGINSTMNSEVRTVLDHRRLVKMTEGCRGSEDIRVDGELMPKAEFKNIYDSPKWINVEGSSGYVFPNSSRVYVSRYLNADAPHENDFEEYIKCYDPEKPFVEIRIEHGENPKNADYSYIMLPMATDEEVEKYAKCPDVEILSNTDALQAVREKNLGITGLVFHKAGELLDITVSAPCIMSLKETDGGFEMQITDPTHKLSQLTAVVTKSVNVISRDSGVEVCTKNGTEITFDLNGSCGAPKAVRFSYI